MMPRRKKAEPDENGEIPVFDLGAMGESQPDDLEKTGDEGGNKPDVPLGRKRRSRTSKGVPMDVNAIEALLLSIHMGLSSFLKVPELALDPKEAESLAKAAANVARHYDLPDMPQKTIDWANLIMTIAAVYGTRVMAMNARFKAERARTINEQAFSAGQ